MNILDLIFPTNCLGCGKEGKYLCSECLLKVRLMRQDCPYCERSSIDGFTHTKCARKLGLDGLTSVWKYEGVIKKAILTLKYKYATEIARELCGNLLEGLNSNHITSLLPLNFHLLPIPIYWHRQNIRGFNQSELIGKEIAKQIGWGFNADVLYRKKSVQPQAKLSVEDRKKNLKGVFAVNPSSNFLTTHNSQLILLFDDVFTTGSTLHEACKVLKRAGVKKVWGMTIAR